jgi:hypothetical protein
MAATPRIMSIHICYFLSFQADFGISPQVTLVFAGNVPSVRKSRVLAVTSG